VEHLDIAVQEHPDIVVIQVIVVYQDIPVHQDNQDLVAHQGIQGIRETVVFQVTAVPELPVTVGILVPVA
jgi:hypothetical protein